MALKECKKCGYIMDKKTKMCPHCGAFVKKEVFIMKYFLLILAILSFLGSILFFFMAKSAVHEIEGLLLFIIFTISLSNAGIIEAIQKSQS